MWPAASQQIGAQTFRTLYTFDASQGVSPSGNLAMGRNGVIYGTTGEGGAYTQCPENDGLGCGTAYSLTPPASPGGAWTEAVLWSFGGTPGDTYFPYGVTMGRDGVLYGNGGGGCGAIFSLTPPASPGGAWTEAVLYQFKCAPDAANPYQLVIDGNGVL
jgi:hypothetical protein